MLQAEQGSNSIGTTCLGMEWKGWIHDKQRGFLTDGDLEIKCGVCFSFGFFFAPTPFQTIPHLLPRKRGIGPCYSSKAIRSSIAIMVKQWCSQVVLFKAFLLWNEHLHRLSIETRFSFGQFISNGKYWINQDSILELGGPTTVHLA